MTAAAGPVYGGVMEIIARAAVSRNEWRKRVARWKESGLTAKEFGAREGINPGTLYFWRYKLAYGDRLDRPPKRGTRSDAVVASLVEVPAPTVVVGDQRFEIELGNGRLIRVSAGFDAESLRALLSVVEAA
jgi:transposase-like protein